MLSRTTTARSTRTTFSVAAVLAAALGLAGCQPPEADEPADPPEATPEPLPDDEDPPEDDPALDDPPEDDPAAALNQECTNPDGFSVSYPEGWITNTEAENGLAPCSLFDPDSVDTGEAMEVGEDIAVFLRIEDADVEPSPMGSDELDREERTVDGRDAVRTEVEHTGEGMFAAGLRTTSYHVDLGAVTFIAQTHDAGDPDYETTRQVLDAMMDTVSFDEAAVPDDDAEEGAWEELPDAPIANRLNHSATWADGLVIVWGGEDQDTFEITADGAGWDPNSGEWQEIPPAPIEGRWAHDALWTGEELIVWGGTAGPDHLAPCYTDGALYDPDTGEWQEIPEAPGDRCAAVTVWSGSELIVFGGHAGNGPPGPGDRHADGAAYDPETGEWRDVPEAPVAARASAEAAWAGSEMVIYGGHTGGEDEGFEYLNDGAAYDPGTDEWRTIAASPLPPLSGLASAEIGGELMVFGGQDPDPEADELETGAAAYDPEADEWRTLEDMPSPQATLVAASTGDVVYILGGGLPQPPPPEEGEEEQEAEDGPAFLAYAAGEDTWVTHPDPPGGPRTHHALAWTGAELVVWGGQGADDGDEAAPGLRWDPPG